MSGASRLIPLPSCIMLLPAGAHYARVVAWLQQHYPHIHGTPKQLEDWPLEALQACLEHIKGKVGATRRWGRR